MSGEWEISKHEGSVNIEAFSETQKTVHKTVDIPSREDGNLSQSLASQGEQKTEADEVKYFYSEEFSDKRTDDRILKNVRFALGNMRIQTVYSPSNQFEFPTEKETNDFVNRQNKRRFEESNHSLASTSYPKKRKKDDDEDFQPDFNEAEDDDSCSDLAIDETEDRPRVMIEFASSDLGFTLEPGEGRYKAAVGEVSNKLKWLKKLHPGMRIYAIDQKKVLASHSFKSIKNCIERLQFPACIEFVDVCENRCRICFSFFDDYDQLVVHMAHHIEQGIGKKSLAQVQPDRGDEHMASQHNSQQSLIRQQITQYEDQVNAAKRYPDQQSQLQSCRARLNIEHLKTQLQTLQQVEGVSRQPTKPNHETSHFAKPPQIMTDISDSNDALTANQNTVLNNFVERNSSYQKLHDQYDMHKILHGFSTQPAQNVSQQELLRIALNQLAALKQIYCNSPQIAIAQLAGLLHIAQSSQVAASQLQNLRSAAMTNPEFSGLFSALLQRAALVLQRTSA